MKRKNERIELTNSEVKEMNNVIEKGGGLSKEFEELIEREIGFKLDKESSRNIASLITSSQIPAVIYSESSSKLEKVANFLYEFAPTATALTSKEFDNSMLFNNCGLMIIEDSQNLSEENIEAILENTIDKPVGETDITVIMMMKINRSDKYSIRKFWEKGISVIIRV